MNTTDNQTHNGAAAVVIERSFDAPVEVVWQMWTEPEHFAAWYGPHGAAIPVAEMDLRVSGRRLICMEMQGPDGSMQMWFTGEFRDIDPHRRLVYTESMADSDGNVLAPEAAGMPAGSPTETEVTVELTSTDDGTRMVMTHAGIPADSPGAMGWNMAIDKLADRLKAGA